MSNQATDPKDQDNKDAAVKPEPETLHTTDPQEHMEGPVSSLMQNIAGSGEKNDEESKEEADAKKDENK
ncbi:MAG: hypothetical protein EOO06_18235 [Chitinophagaceae bacterium]|nr:MAG: hypothetical protein EOO06_18235 [Chitinophagaceae bacterium]